MRARVSAAEFAEVEAAAASLDLGVTAFARAAILDLARGKGAVARVDAQMDEEARQERVT